MLLSMNLFHHCAGPSYKALWMHMLLQFMNIKFPLKLFRDCIRIVLFILMLSMPSLLIQAFTSAY